MTNREKARPIADLPKDDQITLMRQAARVTAKREVRGNSRNRFYAHECGLSPAVARAMREEGHGEEILSGKGANSRRWYFPIEILDRALRAAGSEHGRLHLHAEAMRATHAP